MFLLLLFAYLLFNEMFLLKSPKLEEGGERVCGKAVLCYFWYGISEIYILTCGIAVL